MKCLFNSYPLVPVCQMFCCLFLFDIVVNEISLVDFGEVGLESDNIQSTFILFSDISRLNDRNRAEHRPLNAAVGFCEGRGEEIRFKPIHLN